MEFLAALTWSKAFGWLGTAAKFMLAHWRETLIVVLALVAWHFHSSSVSWHTKADNCEVARKADKKAYVAAQAAAKDKNHLEVVAAETKWKAVASNVKVEYDAKLTAAYAAVSAYASRMRTQTASGASGFGGISPAANPAQGVDGPGQGAFVLVPIGDLNVCAENTVKARSWQVFWNGVVMNWPATSK